uniref:Ycf20 n=1 Tax=Dichotomosiphon tuberosus TaxID=118263 RepID=A0A386AWT4_9CHLO|nr:hypothetical protein Ycf20 [Dichotomosiphon tuberosus]
MRKSQLNKKIYFFYLKIFQKNKNFLNFIEKSLLSLYLGFFIGNFFGTFFKNIYEFLLWDGFIIIFLNLFLEFINNIIYKINKKNIFLKILKNIKIGILIGFFIDAFKVGS